MYHVPSNTEVPATAQRWLFVVYLLGGLSIMISFAIFNQLPQTSSLVSSAMWLAVIAYWILLSQLTRRCAINGYPFSVRTLLLLQVLIGAGLMVCWVLLGLGIPSLAELLKIAASGLLLAFAFDPELAKSLLRPKS